MNVIILCEGPMDRAIIGKYLESCFAIRHIKSKKNFLNNDNYIRDHYKKGENTVDVVSVRGHDFSDAVSTVLATNKYNADVFFDYLAIFSDRDSEPEIQEVWGSIKKAIVEKTKTEFEIVENKWIEMEQPAQFKAKKTIHLLLVPIPLLENGALESLLLDSLSDEPGNKYIAASSKKFVQDLINEKPSKSTDVFKAEYLKSRRSKVKAPLAVFCAVVSPDKSFNSRSQMLEDFDWHHCSRIKEVFKNFDELGI